eukprot:scaffold52930_cov69-Phaeocystis_antarctica.AAC.3
MTLVDRVEGRQGPARGARLALASRASRPNRGIFSKRLNARAGGSPSHIVSSHATTGHRASLLLKHSIDAKGARTTTPR